MADANGEKPTTGASLEDEDRGHRRAVFGHGIEGMFRENFEGDFIELDHIVQQAGMRALLSDIAKHGSIMAYLDFVRGDAIAAVERLADADPADVGLIAEIQRDLAKYVGLASWINDVAGIAREVDAVGVGRDEGEDELELPEAEDTDPNEGVGDAGEGE